MHASLCADDVATPVPYREKATVREQVNHFSPFHLRQEHVAFCIFHAGCLLFGTTVRLHIMLAKVPVAIRPTLINRSGQQVRLSVRRLQLSSRSPDVSILEVGPRDGLQNIKTKISTPVKIELIDRLAATGLRNIEVASFVSPKWVPQLADGHEVMKHATQLAQKSDLRIPVLAPNLKGFQNAYAAGAVDIEVFASATEAFSKANQNCTVDEALNAAERVAKEATANNVRVRGVISCIFSDPYSGPTDPAEVLRVAKRFIDMGCYEVGLGDTLGVGTAKKTRELLDLLLREIPAHKLAGHFHDTYGQAISNVLAAYDMGVRSFDTSVAGLGGCPYAPGAKGNLATEDLVYAFENSGIDTGIDLLSLSKVGSWVSQEIGLPNSSRAGAAIAAKAAAPGAAKPKEATSPVAADSWETIDTIEGLKIGKSGPVVRITLNRPQRGNSMTKEMLTGLTNTYKKLAQDKSVFHILLAAEGKFFCTGMDFSGDTDRTSPENDYYKMVRDLFQTIGDSPQTTIALVDGPAFGGGTGLTFACDARIVTHRARFTLSEVKLGLQPAVISRFMPREWGFSFFREAMLSGREVLPEELLRIGAVHQVLGEGVDPHHAANKYLEKLRACAPESAAKCKELVRLAWSDAGGSKQDAGIQEKFLGMMVPGSEGEHGISQFQKKVRTVDWVKFWADRVNT